MLINSAQTYIWKTEFI